MTDTAELKRLLRRCEGMEHGRERLKTALHLLPLADENGDPWSRIIARYFVAWGYCMADDNSKALPFCAEYFYLLEQYPHIKMGAIFELSLAYQAVSIALQLPQISKEQCRALLDQFETRSKLYNMGKHHFYKISFYFYLEMGTHEQAVRSFERFRVEQMEDGWDCEACRIGGIASALLDLDRREEALHVAQPLLSGVLTCDCEPGSILTSLLLSDLQCGDMDAATANATRIIRSGFQDRSDLFPLSVCLLYHAAADPERSLGLLEKGLAWSVGMLNLTDLFELYRSAWALCTVLAKSHNHLPLQLPARLPVYREDGTYQTAALAEWFYTKAVGIAGKFDRRNDTDSYMQELRWVERGICKR